MNKQRLQFGSVIVEIQDNNEQSLLLTISKFNYDEDRVQVCIPKDGALALASLLKLAAM